jgi:GNAT superfamily N-acetyltransferase
MPQDYKECVDLHRLVVRTDRGEFLEERIQAGRMYVAVMRGRVVGFATFETNFIGCLYVSLLMTHPDFRRKGIARRLMDAVAKHSKDGRIFSSTEADNAVSIQMHEALGFRRSGHIDNQPQVQREIIFCKALPPDGA